MHQTDSYSSTLGLRRRRSRCHGSERVLRVTVIEQIAPSRFQDVIRRRRGQRGRTIQGLRRTLRHTRQRTGTTGTRFIHRIGHKVSGRGQTIQRRGRQHHSTIRGCGTSIRRRGTRIRHRQRHHLTTLQDLSSPQFIRIQDSSVSLGRSCRHVAPRNIPSGRVLTTTRHRVDGDTSITCSLGTNSRPRTRDTRSANVLSCLSSLSRSLYSE